MPEGNASLEFNFQSAVGAASKRRRSFAGDENGYAVSSGREGSRATLVRGRTVFCFCAGSASGSVGLQCITGEPVAFDEHFIDFVNRLSAIAGRMARPERRPELWRFCGLPPHPPAGETPGLARQILKRELEGLEPAG